MMTTDTTPIGVLIIFYLGVFLLFIGLWWWLLPVDNLPKQLPWCTGMLVSFLFFIANERNKDAGVFALALGRLMSLGILLIYFIAFLLSFAF